MTASKEDEGKILVLLERFNMQRLPRALAIKDKVDQGEVLTDSDIDFLEQVFKDFRAAKSLAEKYTEYQPLIAKVMRLYSEITQQAMKNEGKTS